MRAATLVPAFVGGPLLALAGAFVFFVGVTEQGHAKAAYEIAFTHAGAECGTTGLSLDTGTGRRLVCQQNEQTAEPVGLTETQIGDLLAMATMFGSDGLDGAEQLFLQARLDQFVATVPERDRKFAGEILFGWRVALLGAVLMAIAVALITSGRRS